MRTRNGLLGAAAVLSLTLVGCGGGDDAGKANSDAAQNEAAQAGQSQPADSAQNAAAEVKIAQSSLGPILTDQAGRTLYAFTKDKDGASNCADDCIATWPALTSKAAVQAGAGTTASLLGKTQRAEGVAQAVYGDWPLYYYVGDAQPGDLNGQNVDGVWFVVKADGKLVRTSS